MDLRSFFDTDLNSLKQQDRLNRAIKKWKKLGLMETILGFYAKKCKTDRDILETLIIGTYLEHLDELNNISTRVFKEVSKDITRQAKEELPFNVRPLPLDTILGFALVLGVPFKEYLQSMLFMDSEEAFTKVIYSIVQDSPLDLEKSILKQSNRVLDINGDKFSGALHDISIKVGNNTYLEHILEDDDNHLVKFVAVLDQKTTPMCISMDGMIFNTKRLNSFDRETANGLKHYDIVGLVDGINLPPIIDFVHHCRSTLIFVK